MFMNEHEVIETAQLFDETDETPNLAHGAWVLKNLMDWVNSHSDGWPYWQPPQRASNGLTDLLHAHAYAARFGYYQGTSKPLEDVSRATLERRLTPIKSFLTRQGVDWSEVFGGWE